jgi:hypothetical protein
LADREFGDDVEAVAKVTPLNWVIIGVTHILVVVGLNMVVRNAIAILPPVPTTT